ncbi:MAG: cyclic nucleotide-binding domain-containing protein [Myxococcota bacterium]
MGGELTLEQLIAFLMDAPMFGDLGSSELSELVGALQVRSHSPGEWVFREGDAGDAWYVLYEGEVEVVKEAQGAERVIAMLGRRACFGEMAILDGSPRSASVRATQPSTALRFPRSSFTRLLAEGNLGAYKLVHQIALVLVSRQRRTTARLVEALAAGDQASLAELIGPLVDRSAVAE